QQWLRRAATGQLAERHAGRKFLRRSSLLALLRSGLATFRQPGRELRPGIEASVLPRRFGPVQCREYAQQPASGPRCQRPYAAQLSGGLARADRTNLRPDIPQTVYPASFLPEGRQNAAGQLGAGLAVSY